MNADMQKVLALWRHGLLHDEAVVQWADAQIRSSDQPDDLLIELSLKGPKRYWLLESADFPRPEPLSFADQFALRVDALKLESREAVEDFVAWLSSACLGEDLTHPAAKLGYELFHLWDDCKDMDAAVALVRERLPPYQPASREHAISLRPASLGAT